jgi:Rod binding domain-containing protein
MIQPLSITSGAQTQLQQSAKPADEKSLKAAHDFEAIFIRKILSGLEKTANGGESGGLNAGGSTYGSMMVGALADAIANSGGLGLAREIANELGTSQKNSAPEGLKPAQTNSSQVSVELTAHRKQSSSK